MFLKKSLMKRVKVPLLLMLLTILVSFLVPTVLAEQVNPSKKDEAPVNADLTYSLDMYFAIVNYNEPTNPWIKINYYYENGSFITMIYGMDRTVFPSLNLNYQDNFVQVFDRKGKMCGFGFKTRYRSNLYIFVPV
jgi:hypothetical protein